MCIQNKNKQSLITPFLLLDSSYSTVLPSTRLAVHAAGLTVQLTLCYALQVPKPVGAKPVGMMGAGRMGAMGGGGYGRGGGSGAGFEMGMGDMASMGQMGGMGMSQMGGMAGYGMGASTLPHSSAHLGCLFGSCGKHQGACWHDI